MLVTIKAKFQDGVLVPLEPLELPNLKEGDEVFVSLDPKSDLRTVPVEKALQVLRETAGAWQGAHDPEELKRRIYGERLSGAQPDPER